MPKDDDNNNKDENDNKISFLFPFKRYPFHFLGSFVLGAVPIIIWCWMINEISIPPSMLTRATAAPTGQINQFRTVMFNYGMLSGAPPYTTGVGSCRAFFIRQSDMNSCIMNHPNNDGIVIEMGYIPPAPASGQTAATPGRLIPYIRPAKYTPTDGKVTIVPDAYYYYTTDIGCPNDCGDYINLTP